MPSKEIKELRQAGKLAEAYAMATSELEAAPGDIWCKRNLSWVLYSQMDNEFSTFPFRRFHFQFAPMCLDDIIAER